jgi:hypothetical protein
MSTLRSTGDRIDCDDLKHVFVHGAYNLGDILTSLEIATTALHPGEILSHPTGAAGEDNWLICPDEGISPVAVAEINFDQISSCATDYGIGDDIPGIVFHWNPGALLRNIVCVDQEGDVADAGKLLSTSSGTAGALKILTEVALKDSVTGSPEAFNDAVTWGDMGSLHHNRCPMRQAYHQADGSAAYDVVAYILNS